MSEEQANLAANFPDFVQVLDDYVEDPSKGALGYAEQRMRVRIRGSLLGPAPARAHHLGAERSDGRHLRW
jgi:hypothetical protein